MTSHPEDTKQLDMYKECLQKQLDEVDMLSSIFCNPGEIQIYDPGVIIDFNEFICSDSNVALPKMQLDYSVYIYNEVRDKIEIHVNLPHLYPVLENATVSIRASFPRKSKEIAVKNEIDTYISSNEIDKNETYVYQVISWIQDSLDRFLSSEFLTSENLGGTEESVVPNESNKILPNANTDANSVNFERLWIVSHHIKSKTKRQEIVRNAKDLSLSGFSKPGKPGIICVEGLKENTQEFWKIIRSMNWHKIQVKLSEIKKRLPENVDKCRRFDGFREELVTETEDEGIAPMNMSLFMKYLDAHKSGYIRKEIFGFD